MVSLRLALLFLMSAACSTQHSVKLVSYPDKAVIRSQNQDGKVTDLGMTPYQGDQNSLFPNGSTMTTLIIEKDGFESQRVFVGQSLNQNYEISFRLKPKQDDPKLFDIRAKQERLAKNLAVANNLINSKKYDEANRVLTGIVQEFPYVSVSYDLLGNISYLNKDFRQAINHYKKSLDLNPENVDTKQILDRLSPMAN